MRSALTGFGLMMVLATGAQAATIVHNGGFEIIDDRKGVTTGDSDGDALNTLASGSGGRSWDVYKSLPGGWTSSVGAGIEVQTKNTLTTADPRSGDHYVELDSENAGGTPISNSNMFQNLGDLEEGSYILSFWYRPRTTTAADNGIKVELFDGISLVNNVAGSDTTLWTLFSYKFFVPDTSGPLTLRFSATGNPNELGGFLDDIAVAPVPLPAPALLLVGALGGLGLLRRRPAVA